MALKFFPVQAHQESYPKITCEGFQSWWRYTSSWWRYTGANSSCTLKLFRLRLRQILEQLIALFCRKHHPLTCKWVQNWESCGHSLLLLEVRSFSAFKRASCMLLGFLICELSFQRARWIHGLTAVKAGVILNERQKDAFCKRHWGEAHRMSLGYEWEACIWRRRSSQDCSERHCWWCSHSKVTVVQPLALPRYGWFLVQRVVVGKSSRLSMPLTFTDIHEFSVETIFRLPLSLSTLSGEPILIEAQKALNGLRVARLTWSVFLKDFVPKMTLCCSTTEPCLYMVECIGGSPTLLSYYADDFLVGISSGFQVRESGKIALGKDGGGSLKFLCRAISRQAGSPTLVMQVDWSYMDAACEEFGIKVPKGVVGPPDMKPNLEATGEESTQSTEGCLEGYIAWLAQTRLDLLHYTLLLASGQSEPKRGHEKALRQVLRIVITDSKVGQYFPIPDAQEHHLDLLVYTDAAIAPMGVFQRRSMSGAALVYKDVTLKCYSMRWAVARRNCTLYSSGSAGVNRPSADISIRAEEPSLGWRQDLPALDKLEEGVSSY